MNSPSFLDPQLCVNVKHLGTNSASRAMTTLGRSTPGRSKLLMDALGQKSAAGTPQECDMVFTEPTLAAPFKGRRMARREFQMPSVHRLEGLRPYWYIRYRVKVLVGKNQLTRREKWHTLGYCDEITKREPPHPRRGDGALLPAGVG